MITFTERFSPMAPQYDAILSDVWGVVHNGIAATPEACDALARFRAGGGTVMFITNAPRPGDKVIRFLDHLGVPRDAYDGIVSSGDVSRAVVAEHAAQSLFHLGPERDREIFDGLGVREAPAESADFCLCSGLFDDDIETPDDYRDVLAALRARNVMMVCANPDIVVERGERLVYCAGALADAYAALGGEVLYAGKPHPPIYLQALGKVEKIKGSAPSLDRVLAIGDSLRTDVKGARTLGVDCIFLTAGIHAEELGPRDDPDPAIVARTLAAAGLDPKAVMRRLTW